MLTLKQLVIVLSWITITTSFGSLKIWMLLAP